MSLSGLPQAWEELVSEGRLQEHLGVSHRTEPPAPPKQLLWPLLNLTSRDADRQEPPSESAWSCKAEVHRPGWGWGAPQDIGTSGGGEKTSKPFPEPYAACQVLHYFQMHKDNVKFQKRLQPQAHKYQKARFLPRSRKQHVEGH